jgi:putative transposase
MDDFGILAIAHQELYWLGFKSFDSASITLNGIEIVHALRKGQLATQDISVQSLAETFYSVAA